MSSQVTCQMLIGREVEEENIGCHSPMGGHQSVQPFFQKTYPHTLRKNLENMYKTKNA